MKRFVGLKMMTAAVAAVLIGGCMSVDYVGQHYEPTDKALWYNDASVVPPGLYREIGKATLTAPDGYSTEDIRLRLLKEACSVGADAVEVVDARRREIGRYQSESNDSPGMQTTGFTGNNSWHADGNRTYTDSFGQSSVGDGQTVTQYEMVVRAYFLRLDRKFEEKPVAAPPRRTDNPNIPMTPVEDAAPAKAPAKAPVKAPVPAQTNP